MIFHRELIFLLSSLFLFHLIGCKDKISSDDEIKLRISKIERLIGFNNLDSVKVSTDSLIKAFRLTQSVPSDSVKTRFFIKVLDKAIKLDNDSLVHRAAKEAFNLSHKLNDTISKASASWSYGNFYKKKAVMDSAYWYYYQAFKYYQSVNLPIYSGRMLYNMANVQWRQGDYTGSEINTFKAISRLKPLEYSKGLYLCSNHLGVLYMGMGEFDRSLRFHFQALDYAKELHSDTEIYKKISFNNIGNLLREQEKYKKAVIYYKKSLKDINDSNNLVYARRIDNLSYTRFLNGDSTGIIEGFTKAFKIRESINDKPGKVISMFRLAQFHHKFNSSKEAIKFSESAKKLALDIFDYRNALSVIHFLSKIDTTNSINHLNDYIRLNEKIQLEERRTRNKFTRINFETEASKEKSKRLSSQNTKLLIVFFSVVTLLGMVVFIRNQHVKNIELLLDKEQQDASQEIYRLMIDQQSKLEDARITERNRISEELHDGILGRLFGTRLGFGFLKIKSDETSISKFQSYIDEIQNIEMEIRNISHELKNHQQTSDMDFISVMNYFLQTHSETHSYKFSFKNDDYIDWNQVSEEIKVNLYRIIQEATHNFIKYANTNEISIVFSFIKKSIQLVISDNGVGFETSKSKRGIGLKNMLSRTERLKGEFVINSSPNKGTLLKITLPI